MPFIKKGPINFYMHLYKHADIDALNTYWNVNKREYKYL